MVFAKLAKKSVSIVGGKKSLTIHAINTSIYCVHYKRFESYLSAALCLVLIKMATHAYKRFVERYEFPITRGDIRLLEAMIADAGLRPPNAICLGKRTTRTGEWLAMYKDNLVRFVYSNRTGTIITFLPIKAKHIRAWNKHIEYKSMATNNRYVCKQCGKFYRVRSDKAWVKSFCTVKNKSVHLVKYEKRNEKETSN